ncbi:MAG: threonine--tRNA ligase [Candidatus Portnoybacteria bacterium RBG_13_41_18]|uniref:Threonine--tRNA ligase n=1 Tax=Candidatus Portnoybacteria bacterium RBG_13_41_18 TaxID=1801991 RepID=A0A1G2FBG6_9BACT|nr:MAG: threonine--tRNA ligase [Candidatus Portnoybacteria bacterium RBG_13_41_18]
MQKQTINAENKLDILRHSTAHILASVVLDMFPEAKFGIGPTIENGFYYDFDLPRTLIPEDLPLLEEKMRAIIKQNATFEKTEIDAKKAETLFKKAKQPYKVELIKDLIKTEKAKKVTIYKTGSFIDLCRGPHIDSTGEIKPDAFKLLKIAGAYWRGSEKNKMLQRIYGTAWENKKDLDEYLYKLEEAGKRDHRKIGKDLELFSISEKVGPGLILWHPKLSLVRELLEDWWRQLHRERGYEYIYTPHIGRAQLWETSGHLDFFRDSMYPSFKDIETEGEYFLKPMSCPFHVEIYKSRPRSYRELPLRWNELGTCYRYEKSGELHGMARPRGFTQDDAHIICTRGQLKDEYRKAIEFTLDIYSAFNFKELKYFLSIRDPKNLKKYVGDSKIWDTAESTIKEVLKEKRIEYKIEEGGAKFYGPALDIKILDAIGREWQCPTIQLDMNLPSKFGMTYIGPDSNEHVPIMLHRTIFGAMERFCAVLIEHYAGAFPIWLAPEQVWVLPIAERHEAYAKKVAETLKKDNIRVIVKNENETIGKKIRDGELQKIPYLLIVGDKEISADSVAVRERGKGDLGTMKMEKFIEKIVDEIKTKK